MKNILIGKHLFTSLHLPPLLLFVAVPVIFSSCASTRIPLGENVEKVEYKDLSYVSANKKELTLEELREDCDMLEYILYNAYAGIDEAIENGLDLHATIEDIYNTTLTKKTVNTYPSSDFFAITSQKLSKALPQNDQHIFIGNTSLKNSLLVYYSDIYFTKQNEIFVVSKSENEKIKEGMIYTGPEKNLYKLIMNDGIFYRYGVLTSQTIKTANIFVNDEKFSIPVKPDKPIPQRTAWTNVLETTDSVYFSLGDCVFLDGVSNSGTKRMEVFEKFTSRIAEKTAGKKNIIWDLRSNTGGQCDFPARCISAAYYYNHLDSQFQKDLRALFINKSSEGMRKLVSPVTMQFAKNLYSEENSSMIFEDYSPEQQTFYKNYWKNMKTWSIRTYTNKFDYFSNFQDFPAPDFAGDVYILMNAYTASASEFGIQMACLLEDQGINVHLIGEKSTGCCLYGSVQNNYLPNSGMVLSLGISKGNGSFNKNPRFEGERNGFTPEIWATNDSILSSLIYATGDEELREVLSNLGKGLL